MLPDASSLTLTIASAAFAQQADQMHDRNKRTWGAEWGEDNLD